VGTRRPIVFAAHHAVALAATAFNADAIENRDTTPPVGNESGTLQFMGRLGYSFAAHAERVREHFMCHRQLIRSEPIEAHQQPAAHLLIDGMAPIADRHLGYLSEQRVREPEE
jgi:hypothetical protein